MIHTINARIKTSVPPGCYLFPAVMDRSISPPAKRRRLSASPTRPNPEKHTAPDLRDLKVMSWNINGISPFLQPSVASYFKPTSQQISEASTAKASLRDFLRRHSWPTLLFLQEVKINPDDTATIRAVEKAVRRSASEPEDAPEYEAHFCLPSDKFNARGFGRKVYGVCSILRKDFKGHLVSEIRPVSWDSEGRIQVIETKANDKIPKLAIINVYMVNGKQIDGQQVLLGWVARVLRL